MDSMKAFILGKAASESGNPQMVFDWHKAARLIKEAGAPDARAGLKDDWEYTGGDIYKDGKYMSSEDSYCYLSSNWAIPQLMIDGEIHECYIIGNSEGWDHDTMWPESARKILEEATK